MASRGERNNNPGNLEASSWTKSQPGYVGSDGRFAIFDSMANGIAAQEKLLRGYIDKGFTTIDGIINRYGNDPGTADDGSVLNYKKYLSQRLGKSLNDLITKADIPLLTKAMREFETGNKQDTGDAPTADKGWWDTITDPVGAVGDWFTTGIVARIVYVVIGVVLIGLAIAAFVFLTDNGQKLAVTAAKAAA